MIEKGRMVSVGCGGWIGSSLPLISDTLHLGFDAVNNRDNAFKAGLPFLTATEK